MLPQRQAYPCSVATLRSYVTDPERLRLWWHPDDTVVRNVHFDVQPAGSLRIENVDEAGTVAPVVTGQFHNVEPERLVLTWIWEVGDAVIVDQETLLKILFREVKGVVCVELVHYGFITGDGVVRAGEMWSQTLAKLAGQSEQT
ncbi:MAG: SRPBCC family protein [Capsulimonadaceae bacterium]